MSRLRAAIAAATGALLLVPAGAFAQAQGPQLAEIGNPKFPDRSFVLTLPSRESVTSSTLRLRENGHLVEGVSVTPGSVIG